MPGRSYGPARAPSSERIPRETPRDDAVGGRRAPGRVEHARARLGLDRGGGEGQQCRIEALAKPGPSKAPARRNNATSALDASTLGSAAPWRRRALRDRRRAIGEARSAKA